ncbi:TPA: hypothetical protein MO340_004276 [Salmonella enterica subsp. salamae serovar 35:g,m,s,t:-]|nr:hypothetical protein [Salmonella enterica subsp. salamae serovar 35:g,m,s,t:-]HCA3549746.1 hypothetical protein [Salmonella enterica subsp. salamae serovar 35:g,m,s,t:-]
MLIHVTPKFFMEYLDLDFTPRIVDIAVPELGLVLKGDVDVEARKPYPNKCYLVACRKKGRKAMDGILIDTGDGHRLTDFELVTRWDLSGSTVTHRVKMHIADTEYDAVTDQIILWYGFSGKFVSRCPVGTENWIPASCQPRMVMLPEDNKSARDKDIENIRFNNNVNSIIKERIERYVVPTVERARLDGSLPLGKRIPPHADTFVIPWRA